MGQVSLLWAGPVARAGRDPVWAVNLAGDLIDPHAKFGPDPPTGVGIHREQRHRHTDSHLYNVYIFVYI